MLACGRNSVTVVVAVVVPSVVVVVDTAYQPPDDGQVPVKLPPSVDGGVRTLVRAVKLPSVSVISLSESKITAVCEVQVKVTIAGRELSTCTLLSVV